METQFDSAKSIKSIVDTYGPEVAREVVQIFVTDYASKLQKLKNGIEEGNVEIIRFQAHDIKSGCLSMGVKPMSDICEKIERHSESLSREQLKEMSVDLEKYYTEISREYGSYLNRTH